MLRRLNIASSIICSSRNIRMTRSSQSFFKNLKEAVDKEAAKEGLKEDVKKTKIDLDKMMEEQKEKTEKFAQSEKFKKVLK